MVIHVLICRKSGYEICLCFDSTTDKILNLTLDKNYHVDTNQALLFHIFWKFLIIHSCPLSHFVLSMEQDVSLLILKLVLLQYFCKYMIDRAKRSTTSTLSCGGRSAEVRNRSHRFPRRWGCGAGCAIVRSWCGAFLVPLKWQNDVDVFAGNETRTSTIKDGQLSAYPTAVAEPRTPLRYTIYANENLTKSRFNGRSCDLFFTHVMIQRRWFVEVTESSIESILSGRVARVFHSSLSACENREGYKGWIVLKNLIEIIVV